MELGRKRAAEIAAMKSEMGYKAKPGSKEEKMQKYALKKAKKFGKTKTESKYSKKSSK